MGYPQDPLSTSALSPIGAVGALSKARGSWPFPNICTSIVPCSGEVTSWANWLRPAKLMAHGALQDHSPCCPLTLHSPTTWLRGHRRVYRDMQWFCQTLAPLPGPIPAPCMAPAQHCTARILHRAGSVPWLSLPAALGAQGQLAAWLHSPHPTESQGISRLWEKTGTGSG